jgi:uncharacterized protein (TIGR03118 family)
MAKTTDPNMINPWGVSQGSATFLWVSDQGKNVATLYSGDGTAANLVVSVPTFGSNPFVQGPTGQVFNGTTGFDISTSGSATVPSLFIFDNLNGTISGWNPGSTGGLGSSVIAVNNNGLGDIYTGLALASMNGNSALYAADFKSGGGVDVFNSSFGSTGTLMDPNAPSGYAPYNVEAIGSSLFVAYSQVGSNGLPVIQQGDGFIGMYNLSTGVWSTLTSGGALNVPWGMALAPSQFGAFSNDLLIGNFGNGEINAFNPVTGAFVGTLDGLNGMPLTNDFLWSLYFGNGAKGFSSDTLYFTAGIDNQREGLLGEINVSPEPAPLLLLASGLLIVGLKRRLAAEP